MKMTKWSTNFNTLYDKEDKNLNIIEYESCVNEWIGARHSAAMWGYVFAVVLFAGGLWAVYVHELFIAVLLLVLAANSNLQSTRRLLSYEMLCAHKLLAKLINNKSADIYD
jgi:hypothetical protein